MRGFFFCLWFGQSACADLIYRRNSNKQRTDMQLHPGLSYKFATRVFDQKVRRVAWQQSKRPGLDGDNICFQFMNFSSGSVLHLQLNQSHAGALSIWLLECCH